MQTSIYHPGNGGEEGGRRGGRREERRRGRGGERRGGEEGERRGGKEGGEVRKNAQGKDGRKERGG